MRMREEGWTNRQTDREGGRENNKIVIEKGKLCHHVSPG